MTPRQKEIVVDAIRKLGDGGVGATGLYGLLQEWAGKPYGSTAWTVFVVGGLVVYACVNGFAFLVEGRLSRYVEGVRR